MSHNNIIRVAEFEKLYYDDQKPFKKKHWEALCRYVEALNHSEDKRIEYFRILNKGIQFTQFVGVIQAGNLTIEVLPKIDREATTAANLTFDNLDSTVKQAKQKWHAVLLQMLKECQWIKVNEVGQANLQLRNGSILNIYIHLFLQEAEQLLHKGLVRKYGNKEGNQLSLKGQLLFNKHIAANCVRQERFYVRHTEYNRTNSYNQLLYKTIRLIPSITSNALFLDRVGRLLLDFPEQPDCLADENTFQKLSLGRKTEPYRQALLIARMLLLNFRPDIRGGAENVLAILFDMNKLWEEWVYRRLKKEEVEGEIAILRQQSTGFWQSATSSTPKKIRPDIVVKIGGSDTIIIDTKWKIVKDLMPGDADLKQIYLYNHYWQAEKGILLYPSALAEKHHGHYIHHLEPGKRGTACIVQTIHILDDQHQLRPDFGAHLLKLLRESQPPTGQ